ncbi:MAG: FMN-binding glutamate synthase family protein [Acidimicrobiales bacterium]
MFQLGTSYFGCRDARGAFDLDRLVDLCAEHPIRAVEIKLSQGAKPGLGGLLPAAKVTPEIAEIRGIPVAADCKSPPAHSAFHDVDSMLDLVERIAEATGLPVGIKSAVGEDAFWDDLALRMDRTGRGVDFITVDGGEGGTGAGPLVFTDHVALPFKWAFSRVYRAFAERGLHEQVVFIGSGKLGIPENALLAFALGCDQIAVGREAMMAAGCIQSQRCHTGNCPTGVATQNPWLQRGLDPSLKSVRVASYLASVRFELLRLSRACGQPHPGLVAPDAVDVLLGELRAASARQLFDYKAGWGLPSPADQEEIRRLMAEGVLAGA